MNPVTLKQLRYFDALARHMHFGRAAEACYVTQPALSMQVQELEAALGAALIERARSGLRLTPIGEEVARRAARALSDCDDLLVFCQQAGAPMSAPLRLGVIPSVAAYILPGLLKELRETYPELELRIRETQTRTLLEELSGGLLDVLLLALPVAGAELATLPLFDDPFYLAVPQNYPMSRRLEATADIVASGRLLLLEEGHCLRDQALEYCALKQVRSVDTFGVSTLSTVAGMVAAGQGITLLPQICLAVETAGRPIRIVRFEPPEPSRTLGLAWRATSPRRADFEALGRLVARARAAAPVVGGKAARTGREVRQA